MVTEAVHAEPDWVENSAPTSRLPRLQLGDVWKHRELIYFFAQRDVKVRYKQAYLGAAWALLQPLVGALTFTIVFSRLAGVRAEGGSYFAFALTGFIVWTYCSSAIVSGSNSLLNNSSLITKVFFPRIVAPVAALLPALIDLAVGVVLAIGTSLVAGNGVSVGFPLLLPAGVVLLIVAVCGPVLFFSASVVRYRDTSALVTLGLQFVLFVSPVAYPPSLVPGRWQALYYANPIAGALALVRAALISTDVPPARYLALSFAVAIVGLVAGLLHFRSRERGFADVI